MNQVFAFEEQCTCEIFTEGSVCIIRHREILFSVLVSKQETRLPKEEQGGKTHNTGRISPQIHNLDMHRDVSVRIVRVKMALPDIKGWVS